MPSTSHEPASTSLSARTVADGEHREHSATVRRSDTTPLPGSLSSTGEIVEEAGRRALIVPADLTNRESVVAAAERVLSEWGPVDVLVNNGRYIGPGDFDCFEDTPLELLDLQLEANVMAPLTLIKLLLPGMLERGAGVIVNITSGAAWEDPRLPAGKGGWGLGYGITKGALHRVAGILAVELGDRGIHAYNVRPNQTATERRAQEYATYEFAVDPAAGAPPDVVGAVVAWLVTEPTAAEPNGRSMEAQDVCRELNLVPGWPAHLSPAAGTDRTQTEEPS